jgi:hypothetical protein
MTVQELIDKLREFPLDMPVVTDFDFLLDDPLVHMEDAHKHDGYLACYGSACAYCKTGTPIIKVVLIE